MTTANVYRVVLSQATTYSTLLVADTEADALERAIEALAADPDGFRVIETEVMSYDITKLADGPAGGGQ